MSCQKTLDCYFNSRKRPAPDDIKSVNEKVVILDKNGSVTSKEIDLHERSVIYKESPKSSSSKPNVAPKLQRKTPKTVPRSFLRAGDSSAFKTSAKKSLLSSFNASDQKNKAKDGKNFFKSTVKKSLLSSFDGSLKKDCEILKDQESHTSIVSEKIETANENDVINENCEKLESHETDHTGDLKGILEISKVANKSEIVDNTTTEKELDLSAIKKKLIKSSRLNDLKKSLKRINEGHKILSHIQSRKPTTPTKSPSLKEFKAIELEVNTSPCKMTPTKEICKLPDSPSLLRRSVFLSPCKSAPNSQPFVSPKKLIADSLNSLKNSSETSASTSNQGAFERFSALTCSGKPSLTLPFKYRLLAETFRAVDTVVSIMQNRGEKIMFSKLKSSVQQLSKKNLYESHLGQIISVFPKAYILTQEKIRVLGSQDEKYELVIKPNFENKRDDIDKSNLSVMTPSILLDRRRQFFITLLDVVKTQHEAFLKALDPPLIIPRENLTRWHPEFDVESCPEIKTADLPQPPNVEKYSTARDVLEKAKDLFGVNPRMEKALERLSEKNNYSTTTSKTIPSLANALKGIPKSLLEKVRARQAAKTMELLTRNPEDNKKRFELNRLPELARILRNIYVTEKKNVILKPLVIQKMCENYREIIDKSEMSHLLDLLQETVPGWIVTNVVRNNEFVKLSKQTEMSEVLSKINQLSAKHKINF